MKITAYVIALVAPVLGLYDIVIFAVGGNEATISKNFLRSEGVHPWMALEFVWGLGLLCGHLFLPVFQNTTLPLWRVIARVVALLSPSLRFTYLMAFGTQGTDADIRGLFAHGVFMTYMEVVLTFAVAVFVGHRAVPQHV